LVDDGDVAIKVGLHGPRGGGRLRCDSQRRPLTHALPAHQLVHARFVVMPVQRAQQAQLVGHDQHLAQRGGHAFEQEGEGGHGVSLMGLAV
jgi:hypothetical protein